METKSADGKFEIQESQRDDDSYMSSYTSYSWSVVSVETRDELARFSGSGSSDSSGSSQSGTKSVSFSAAGDAVVATDYDGKETRVALPVSVRLVDGGAAVEVTWRGGRVERRKRREVITTTKFGQPIVQPLVGEPEREPARKKAVRSKKMRALKKAKRK